jgi:hypothetical protein
MPVPYGFHRAIFSSEKTIDSHNFGKNLFENQGWIDTSLTALRLSQE